MTSPQPLEARRTGERRQWPRYAVARRAPVALTADGRRFDCLIEDVCLGGARLRFQEELPGNLEVRLEHPIAGSCHGTRTWRSATAMGIAFDFSAGALDLVVHCVGLIDDGDADAGPDHEPA